MNRVIPETTLEKDLQIADRELREFLGEPAVLQYVVEPRITAVEVVMIYEKGTLRSASTKAGPVTPSVKTILTVPLTLFPLRKEGTVPDYLEIVTEVYMESEPFIRLNQDRAAKTLSAFPDLKAAVEDSLSQTDPRISAKRPLNYFCSRTGTRHDLQAATHYELMVVLQEFGLRVNRPHLRVANGIDEVIDHCRRLRQEKYSFPYRVEGALIRVNALDLQATLAHAPGNRSGMFLDL